MSENRRGDVYNLKTEATIAVFALLINFGYFKLTEIDQFVKIFSAVAGQDITVGDFMTTIFAGLCYLLFLGSIVMGLLFTLFKRDALAFIATALFCFFGLYVTLLMRAFNEGFSAVLVTGG